MCQLVAAHAAPLVWSAYSTVKALRTVTHNDFDFSMLTRLYEPPTELSAGQCAKAHTSGPLDQTVTKALRSLAGLQVEQSAYQRE